MNAIILIALTRPYTFAVLRSCLDEAGRRPAGDQRIGALDFLVETSAHYRRQY
jgi:hypothetical protein